MRPVFAVLAIGVKPDVLGDPVHGVTTGREQEKAREKKTENGAQGQGQGMDAQTVQYFSRLSKVFFDVFHDVSPYDQSGVAKPNPRECKRDLLDLQTP